MDEATATLEGVAEAKDGTVVTTPKVMGLYEKLLPATKTASSPHKPSDGLDAASTKDFTGAAGVKRPVGAFT